MQNPSTSAKGRSASAAGASYAGLKAGEISELQVSRIMILCSEVVLNSATVCFITAKKKQITSPVTRPEASELRDLLRSKGLKTVGKKERFRTAQNALVMYGFFLLRGGAILTCERLSWSPFFARKR